MTDNARDETLAKLDRLVTKIVENEKTFERDYDGRHNLVEFIFTNLAALRAAPPATEAITVYKDGSWKARQTLDAYYAEQGDRDWLVTIPARAAPDTGMRAEMQRLLDHFESWARDHSEDATPETWAIIHCSRAALSNSVMTTPTDTGMRQALEAIGRLTKEHPGRSDNSARQLVLPVIDEIVRAALSRPPHGAYAREGDAVSALKNLRFYRPADFATLDEMNAERAKLHAIGDMRQVFVNQGDWIMVEMAIRALASGADEKGRG